MREGHVAHVGYDKSYNTLVKHIKVRGHLGYEAKIYNGHKEIRCGSLDWIKLDEEVSQRWAVVNPALNLRVSLKEGIS
jgi:hypothetical protein